MRSGLLLFSLIIGSLFTPIPISLAQAASTQVAPSGVAPTLTPHMVKSTNASYGVMSSATAYTALFKNDSDTSKAIVFVSSHNGIPYQISTDVSTSQFHYAASAANGYAIISMATNMNPGHTTISLSGPNATYAGAWTNTNLIFTAGDQKLKETLRTTAIFPSSNPSLTAYLEYAENVFFTTSLSIYANGVHQTSGFFNTNGQVNFNDANNITQYILPAPFTTDSAGHSTVSTYRISVANGVLVVNILVPIAWVNAATFPIYIDPSTITTSTNVKATCCDESNDDFFMVTRYWAFFGDGSNLVFSSSTDGVSWATKTTYHGAIGSGENTGIYVDSTKVFYSACVSGTCNYRRGAPQSGGTITWDFAESSLTTTCTGAATNSPLKDTNGNFWLAVQVKQSACSETVQGGGTGTAGDTYIEIWKCASIGLACFSKSTAYDMGNTNGWFPKLLAFSGGDMLLLVCSDSTNRLCKYASYTSGAWNAIHTGGTNFQDQGETYSAVAISTTAFMCVASSTTNIEYFTLTDASTPTVTDVGKINVGSFGQCAMSTDGSNAVSVAYSNFGASGTTINFRLCFSSCTSLSNFQTETVFTSGETNINQATLDPAYTQANSCMILIWTGQASSPFNVRFGCISITVTQPITCTMDNSAPQLTVALSGGGVTPTSLLCDGNSHSVTVGAASTLTATEPADGTNTRGRFNVGSTPSTTINNGECASGTCTAWTFTNYYQLLNNYTMTPQMPTVWDYAYKICVTSKFIGATTSTCVTVTNGGGAVTESVWFDYNRQASYDTPVALWIGQAPTSFTDTTGGNAHNVNYIETQATTTTTTTTTSQGATIVAPVDYSFLYLVPFALMGIVLVVMRKKFKT